MNAFHRVRQRLTTYRQRNGMPDLIILLAVCTIMLQPKNIFKQKQKLIN